MYGYHLLMRFDLRILSKVPSSCQCATSQVHQEALNLIGALAKKSTPEEPLQVAIGESLTAGQPCHGGLYKYGCFGVYDTDAKRVLLSVSEQNVYTESEFQCLHCYCSVM